jgi:hypothetical protein
VEEVQVGVAILVALVGVALVEEELVEAGRKE